MDNYDLKKDLRQFYAAKKRVEVVDVHQSSSRSSWGDPIGGLSSPAGPFDVRGTGWSDTRLPD